jgi:hypothetical protein
MGATKFFNYLAFVLVVVLLVKGYVGFLGDYSVFLSGLLFLAFFLMVLFSASKREKLLSLIMFLIVLFTPDFSEIVGMFSFLQENELISLSVIMVLVLINSWLTHKADKVNVEQSVGRGMVYAKGKARKAGQQIGQQAGVAQGRIGAWNQNRKDRRADVKALRAQQKAALRNLKASYAA